MEHFTNIEKRYGVDVCYRKELHPDNDGKDRIGKSGFDKKLKLNDILDIAYSMENPRPNIIIKSGKNGKWYLKYCITDKIDEQIEKNKWRDCSRITMYIITWE